MSSKQYKPSLIGPSPRDDRDFLYGKILASSPSVSSSLPDSYKCPGHDRPVVNQGQWGSCAAHAGVFAHSCHRLVETGEWADLSEAFTYAHRWEGRDRQKYGLPEGMYMRDLVKIMRRRGTALETELPYAAEYVHAFDIFEDQDKLKKLYETSIKHRIDTYARVYSKEEIKAALYNNGPLLIAVPVYNYGKTMWKKEGDQILLGGHAMAVSGYDKEGLFIRNSWGESWGDKGYTKLPWEDLDHVWELWTTIDEKYDPETSRKMPPRLEPEPEPEPIEPEPKWYKDPLTLLIIALSIGALMMLCYI